MEEHNLCEVHKCGFRPLEGKKTCKVGGVLSEHIFIFYTDPIIREILEIAFGCRLRINKMNIQTCGDDIVVYSSSPMGLRVLIDTLHDLATAHGPQVNPSRITILVFSRTTCKNFSNSSLSFSTGASPLEAVEMYSYLGIVLMHNILQFCSC